MYTCMYIYIHGYIICDVVFIVLMPVANFLIPRPLRMLSHFEMCS